MRLAAALCAVTPLCALASPAAHTARKVSYDGYSVHRVPVGDDVAKVTDLVAKLDLETWKSFKKPGSYADVVVPPEKLAAFQAEVAGIEGVEVMHEDLAVSIAAEQEPAMSIMSEFAAAAAVNTTWFQAYHSYADHLSYFKTLQTRYPNNVETVTSGTSLQGNAISGVHIYGSAGKGVKPAVVFHGTVHAREWITTMVSPRLSFNHCESYETDYFHRSWSILRKLCWATIPSMLRLRALSTSTTSTSSQS